METLRTPLTDMLGIKYPIMLAGMGSVSGHDLVAAVSNAGGIGTLGGATFELEGLKREIKEVKKLLKPGAPFGVDLLIPKVGGGARKTNHDYTHGALPQMADVMIEEGVKLFVCAVGVPPKWLVDKLHAAGIVCMNMVGAPQHVPKALEVGMDVICAQGTEAGGHTGDIATLPLIPQCVDLCRGRKNFFGVEVPVVAAGGIYDGRGLGASLCLGAAGVWVGTRFIACEEANAGPVHKKRIMEASSNDMTRTEIFTGRPCRVLRTPYVQSWDGKQTELRELLGQGVIPFVQELQEGKRLLSEFFPALMGQCAGAIRDVKTADEIVQDMMKGALESLRSTTQHISRL
uniref:Nitronate monooxygenase domain-containing protein n=1 Tax=Alexandrium monilatum TaxID=311494 RepID=A0A7S4SWE5_9DINO